MRKSTKKRFKILCFFGTRPEAIKMAPVVKELKGNRRFQVIVAVSAQHRRMLDQVLELFNCRSDVDLDLMQKGQSLFDITGRVLSRFEPVLEKNKPDLVVVHGDTTTTLGGALAAFYKGIPVGHVEAGLRTRDMTRPFPEEINRRLTDVMSTLHFVPTPEAKKHLQSERLSSAKLFVTGNTIIDSLQWMRKRVKRPKSPALRHLLKRIDKKGNRLVLMTAHRRENFGLPFIDIFNSIRDLSLRFPDVHWVYPVHPNPNVMAPAERLLQDRENVHLLRHLDYGDLVYLMSRSYLVMTDSGGLQEEAPSLGKPVLVFREITERPEAIRAGAVHLVGSNPGKIKRETVRLLTDKRYYRSMAKAVNPYGDGKAAPRIRQAIERYFKLRSNNPRPFRGKR